METKLVPDHIRSRWDAPRCQYCGAKALLSVCLMAGVSPIEYSICTACDHAAWASQHGDIGIDDALGMLEASGLSPGSLGRPPVLHRR